jgi:hypothetical protein
MPVRPALVFALALAIGAVAAHGGAASPSSAVAGCATTASPPFLYSVVIPDSAVQCDATERRIKIQTELTRDGFRVASSSRTCRDTSVCRLTVDASAPDEPGDQVWCTVARGYVGRVFVGEARACETDAF